MKVAAYQAPPPSASASFAESLDLIRQQAELCDQQGVEVLCCPEAVLGGLADNTEAPQNIAIDADSGRLDNVLKPLAGTRVTLIIGYTERSATGELFNAAAVYRQGVVEGVYRKHHPAIRSSVYTPGTETPVFTVGPLTFGILICNDSNFAEPAKTLVANGAQALFIPTNNALPPAKADVVDLAKEADRKLATEHNVYIIRADVAGDTGPLVSYGSTEIVAPDGKVIASQDRLTNGLITADIQA